MHAEGISTCKLDQINAHPKGKWYQLAREKTEQQTVGYMDQSAKLKLDQNIRSVDTGTALTL